MREPVGGMYTFLTFKSRLLPPGSLSQNRSSLTPSIRCRHHNLRQIRPVRNCLSQPNGAPPADTNHTIGPQLACNLHCLLCDILGRMHRCIGVQTYCRGAEKLLHFPPGLFLHFGREDKGAGTA